MKSPSLRALALCLVVLALPVPPARAGGGGPIKMQGELLKRARISLARAVEKALEACPGHAVAARLTTDDEGAPAYRVTVHRGDKASDVWVDGIEGKTRVKDTWKDDDGQTPKGE